MKMANVHKIISFILILAMILAFSGCETYNNFRKAFIDPPVEEETVIKIGIFEPTTGRQSYDAEDEIAGIELAHSVFSSVEGFRIELVYQDNRSSIEEAPLAAKALVNAGVVCLLGSVSSTLSLAASDTLLEAKIPAIAPTNTVNILTATNEYYFRACYTEDFEEQGSADFLINKIKTKELETRQESLKRGETASISDEELLELVKSQTAIIISSNAGLSEADLFDEKVNNYFGINSQTQADNTITTYTLPDNPSDYEQFLASIADEKGDQAYIYMPIPMELAQNLIIQAETASAFEWQQYEIINDPDSTVLNDEEIILVGQRLVRTSEPAFYNFTFVGNSNWEGTQVIDNVYYASTIAKDTVSGQELVYSGIQDAQGMPQMMAKGTEKTSIEAIFDTAYCEKYSVENTDEVSTNFKLGFDAYYILYKALEQIEDINLLLLEDGSIDGLYLHSIIAKTENLETLTKTLSYNSYGDPIRQIFIYGPVEGPEQEQEELENTGEILYDENGNEILPEEIETRVYGVIYVSTPNA